MPAMAEDTDGVAQRFKMNTNLGGATAELREKLDRRLKRIEGAKEQSCYTNCETLSDHHVDPSDGEDSDTDSEPLEYAMLPVASRLQPEEVSDILQKVRRREESHLRLKQKLSEHEQEIRNLRRKTHNVAMSNNSELGCEQTAAETSTNSRFDEWKQEKEQTVVTKVQDPGRDQIVAEPSTIDSLDEWKVKINEDIVTKDSDPGCEQLAAEPSTFDPLTDSPADRKATANKVALAKDLDPDCGQVVAEPSTVVGPEQRHAKNSNVILSEDPDPCERIAAETSTIASLEDSSSSPEKTTFDGDDAQRDTISSSQVSAPRSRWLVWMGIWLAEIIMCIGLIAIFYQNGMGLQELFRIDVEFVGDMIQTNASVVDPSLSGLPEDAVGFGMSQELNAPEAKCPNSTETDLITNIDDHFLDVATEASTDDVNEDAENAIIDAHTTKIDASNEQLQPVTTDRMEFPELEQRLARAKLWALGRRRRMRIYARILISIMIFLVVGAMCCFIV